MRTLALLALLAGGGSDVVDVRVFPAEIELSTSSDRQSFVVQIVQADGVTQDATDVAQISFADPALLRREANTLFPMKDGKTEMSVTAAGRTLKVPVTVSKSGEERPVSFKLDVMPVFMRAGCNTGACHGAARGKDGFRLSLFGFDPDGDHFRLTRELAGRRISVALPKECLLVEKTTGAVQHTGGERYKTDSALNATILRWLEAGAPKDAADVATPVSLELLPTRLVLQGEKASQRITVRAKYSDGTDRDVTPLSVYMSSNDGSAKIEDGLVTAGRRGEAYVFARFATFTVGAQVIVIPKESAFTWPGIAEHNYIDTHVFNKLKKLRMLPSDLCDDATFLRRLTLDITGVLPTPEEHASFLADASPDKRAKRIDELLGRKEFAELWVMKWAELLQIKSDNQGRMSYKGTLNYFNWLQQQIADNVPFNEMVRDLLSSTGGTFTNAATNFYQVEQDTLKLTENVAQVFMGMRIQCAQCHNHPFDRWTMDDYYGFAAFFSQVGRKNGEDPRERIIFNRATGDVKHPVGGRTMAPRFLGGETPDLKGGRDRREMLGEWLASPQNPYFARNLANVVWAHFLGSGIVEPVDDVRVSNPPGNPELLEELARRFTEYKYDFKKLVRDICLSRTYQVSTRGNPTNELDERNFAKAAIRRIRAEVLLDVISQVTDTPNKFRGLPLGARAVQIADGRTSDYFLSTFGRATRETVCSCEVKMEPNLSQALHLLNGQTSNQRIQQGGLVKRLLAEGKTAEQVVDALYVRCLSRTATAREKERLLPMLKGAEKAQLQQELDDVLWALLNSNEFIFNH